MQNSGLGALKVLPFAKSTNIYWVQGINKESYVVSTL